MNKIDTWAALAIAIFLCTQGLRGQVNASEKSNAAGEGQKTDRGTEGRGPIARIWRGRTLASKADEYQAYLEKSGITKIRSTPGNRGVYTLRRSEGAKTEFLVMSLWDSVEAIKKFAGEDYQKAVILPKDREYLLEVEPNVVHYQVVDGPSSKP